MATHIDYYDDEADARTHNLASSFPQLEDGDSWVGALCHRHTRQAEALFAGCHAVRCTTQACPAECCVCNGEYAPREAA